MCETEHACEAYPDAPSDHCSSPTTEWSERLRSWLCSRHMREYIERADYVAKQRAMGKPFSMTWHRED